MRFAAFFLFLALGPIVAMGCSPSIVDACDAYAASFCSRNLACLTGNDLQEFEAVYTSSQDTCVTTYENDTCASDQCPPGIDYDTNQKEQCATDYQSSSCADIMQPGYQPDSCSIDKICHN